MFASVRSAAPLLLSTVFLLLGVSLLHTVIAVDGEARGFSVVMLGSLTSLYYVGFLVGTWLIPRLTHRIGHIRAFAFCTVSVAILVLLQIFSSAYWLWLVLRMLQGLLLVGLYAITESWLNAGAPPKFRGSVFAVYMMLNLGAGALGPQFMRFVDQSALLFAIVAILVGLASLPVVTSSQPQPEMEAMPRIQLRRFTRLVPTAISSALVSGLLLGPVWGLLPVYASAQGFDTARIASYMSIALAGGVALQLPLGHFADRIDRRLAIAVISAAAALAAAGSLFLPDLGPALGGALIFIFCGMSFTLYPIAVAHLVDYINRDELLSASSTVLLLNGLGSAIGPLAVGALMNRWSPQMLFVWFMVLSALLAVHALWRFTVRKREITPGDSFKPMAQTSPRAMNLRSEEAHATGE